MNKISIKIYFHIATASTRLDQAPPLTPVGGSARWLVGGQAVGLLLADRPLLCGG